MKITASLLLALIAFAIGFLAGRAFPAHHYQQIQGAVYFDSATGKACNPFKAAIEKKAAQKRTADSSEKNNPFDQALEEEKQKQDPSVSDFLPACGTE
jgi:hypothetical protein